MVEQLSTTTAFDLPVDEIIEQALGEDFKSAKDLRDARRALNLLQIDIQNRGMTPLSKLELKTVALTSGSANGYTLSADAFAVLDGVVEVSTNAGKRDYPVVPMSHSEWLEISDKETPSRPSMVLVQKGRDNITLNFYPTPDANNFTYKAWTATRTKDINKSYQLVDFKHTYLPALVMGLRYHIACINWKTVPLEERQNMKNEYLEALDLALSEDRERVDLQVYPQNKKQL